jgi:hypothetical protein
VLVVSASLVVAGCGGDMPLPLPDGHLVLATVDADLDGDGRDDRVHLVGQAPTDGAFRGDLGLVVAGESARLWPLPSAASGGYEPSLVAADVTGDGRPELVVSAATGGSGGLVAAAVIATDRRDAGGWRFTAILDAESRAIPSVGGALTDGFVADLVVTAPGLDDRTERLDLSGRREDYLATGTYDTTGVLAEPAAIWGDGVMGFEPVGADAGGPGVQLVQQARGVSNADRLAEVRTLLVWRDGAWVAADIAIRPLP